MQYWLWRKAEVRDNPHIPPLYRMHKDWIRLSFPYENREAAEFDAQGLVRLFGIRRTYVALPEGEVPEPDALEEM